MLRQFAAISVFAAFALSGASAARAQMTPTAPIVVRSPKSTSNSSSSATVPSGSQTWMNAEVLHADLNSMVVSEQGNERTIHTFTYTDKVKTKMQKIINAGGYQYGDRIRIRYVPGNTVALKIHGKPSKAS